MNKFKAGQYRSSKVFTKLSNLSSRTSTSQKNQRPNSRKKFISIYSQKVTASKQKQKKLNLVQKMFCSKHNPTNQQDIFFNLQEKRDVQIPIPQFYLKNKRKSIYLTNEYKPQPQRILPETPINKLIELELNEKNGKHYIN